MAEPFATIANYEQGCSACEGIIYPGEPITRARDRSWKHYDCSKALYVVVDPNTGLWKYEEPEDLPF